MSAAHFIHNFQVRIAFIRMLARMHVAHKREREEGENESKEANHTAFS